MATTGGFPLPVATLASTILTATPDQQRQIWSNAAQASAATEDPFKHHEGGPDSIIEVRQDLAAGGNGALVTYPINNEFYNDPIRDDTPITDSDDYQSDELASDNIRVGLIKFPYSRSKANDQHIPREILGGTPQKLGRQLGREMYQDTAMTHLHLANPSSSKLIKAGSRSGATGISALTFDDEFEFADLLTLAGILNPNGGKPMTMKTDSNGGVVKGYHVLATTPAWTSLKADPTVQNKHMYAAQRSDMNPVFTGEVNTLDGHVIQHFCPVDHTNAGPVGSPYCPKAFLGTAITNADAQVYITGGRNATNGAKTRVKYFKWFPRYAFPFINRTVLSAAQTALTTYTPSGSSSANLASSTPFWENATTDFYVRITEVGGPTAKWGIWKVTGNDGNQLTISERLGTAGGTYRKTTVGNVTYDSAKHTNAFSSGALIQLCNSYGVPIMCTPMFGAGALRRAYGIYNGYRHMDPNVQGLYDFTYLYTFAGHGVRKDFGALTPGVINLIHAYKQEGWNQSE